MPGKPLPVIIIKPISTVDPSSSNSGAALFNTNAEEQPKAIDKGSLRVSHVIPHLSPTIATNYSPSDDLETSPTASSATSTSEVLNPKAAQLDTVAINDSKPSLPSLGLVGEKKKISEAERCKLNREKRKRKMKNEEIELEQLEKRNKVLKSREADLGYKVETLRASYLSSIKTGQVKTCHK